MLGPEQYLGRSIPERHNLVRVLPEWDRKCARETKIRKFEVAAHVQQQVLRQERGRVMPPPPSEAKGRANGALAELTCGFRSL